MPEKDCQPKEAPHGDPSEDIDDLIFSGDGELQTVSQR